MSLGFGNINHGNGSKLYTFPHSQNSKVTFATYNRGQPPSSYPPKTLPCLPAVRRVHNAVYILVYREPYLFNNPSSNLLLIYSFISTQGYQIQRKVNSNAQISRNRFYWWYEVNKQNLLGWGQGVFGSGSYLEIISLCIVYNIPQPSKLNASRVELIFFLFQPLCKHCSLGTHCYLGTCNITVGNPRSDLLFSGPQQSVCQSGPILRQQLLNYPES